MGKSTIQDVIAARAAFKLAVESYIGAPHRAFTSSAEPLLTSTDDVLTSYLGDVNATAALITKINAAITAEEQIALAKIIIK